MEWKKIGESEGVWSTWRCAALQRERGAACESAMILTVPVSQTLRLGWGDPPKHICTPLGSGTWPLHALQV